MNLMDYTIETGFLPQLKCESLEQVVAQLVDTLVVEGAVAGGADLVREVMRREVEGSTAVGGGLMIPHARYSPLAEVRIAVATLAEPITGTAADNRPVDIVILLIGPEGDPRQMLRVLARLARLVKQGSFLDALRGAKTMPLLRNSFALAEQTAT